jgi:iron complex transport system substrate-binding protein
VLAYTFKPAQKNKNLSKIAAIDPEYPLLASLFFSYTRLQMRTIIKMEGYRMLAGLMRKRVSAILMASLMLFIAACGGGAAGGGNGGSAGAEASPSAEAAASTEAEASPSASNESSNGTRVVSTVKGDVEIPAEPKRIVALYYHHILLAFGVKPVGANLTWWGGSPYLAELEGDGIVDVGGPPSLEAVTALEPDLIIVNNNNEEDYDQLSKIAPTVMIPYDAKRNVYEDAKLIAELINKPEVGNQLLDEFEEKAAAARAKLAGKVDGNAKAAIIRIEGQGGQFAVFGENYGRGGWPIYEGLKLQQPDKIKEELEKDGLGLVQQLSMELLPEFVADADYIFVSKESEGIDEIQDKALWQSIPAVKEGRVIELDGKSYYFFDPISINGQIDSITELLLKLP